MRPRNTTSEEERRLLEKWGKTGGLLTDFLPVVGDIKAGADTLDALNERDYIGAGLSAAGIIPVVGDVISKAGKTIRASDSYLSNAVSKSTQRGNTVETARKSSKYLDSLGASGRSLDYGAGKGVNAKAIKIDDTFEPFPQEGYIPDFSKPREVPPNTYGKIISTNVINVLPPDLRVEAILNIGKALKPNGKALIQTWDISAAKAGMASKTAIPVKGEDFAYRTSTGTYQKGFNKRELKEYAESVLGERYIVDIVPAKEKINGTAIVITKK